jgi:hypothetical protein
MLWLECIEERDMDLLLLEELHVSNAFAAWFVSKAFQDQTFGAFISACHSVSEAAGESDLEFVFNDTQGRNTGLLIENKIGAVAQPDQALRYRQRAKKKTADGSWQSARTCIVAPQEYLDATPDAAGYDSKISYEDIADWFGQRAPNDVRAGYRKQFVRAAIEQLRRGYTQVKDETVTEFWRKYRKAVDALFPALQMYDPKYKSAQSIWVVFHPKALGKQRTLNHKMRMGVVDLNTEFPASRLQELSSAWAPLLEPDMSVVATGNSLSVRVEVHRVDVHRDYDAQADAASEAMRAAYRLLNLSPALVATP